MPAVPSEPGRTPLRPENVCVIPVAETRPLRRAAFALPSGCLKTRERPWLEGLRRTGITLRLYRDARASRSRFTEPNSQVPLSVGKILPV
jgi:hypothetical protein